MYFKEKRHKEQFIKFTKERTGIEYSNTFLAVIYLITADKELWGKSQRAVERDKLNFDKIKLNGISITGYTFCKVAIDIYNGNADHLGAKDLANRNIISNNVYRVIQQALQICRFGIKNNKKRTNTTNNR